MTLKQMSPADALPWRRSNTPPADGRCSSVGLRRGDCHQQRLDGKLYCYYHQKLADGLTTPTADVYPVWPLPMFPWELVRPNTTNNQKELTHDV